jgi:hypothetical protein
MNRPVFETTATALREKSKLRRHFRRFDMFFYLICSERAGTRTTTWPRSASPTSGCSTS